jgi:hypothetical protein
MSEVIPGILSWRVIGYKNVGKTYVPVTLTYETF